MRFEALYIFLILLFGLILCSFLGGNCGVEGFEDKIAQQTGVSGADTELYTTTTTESKDKTSYDNYNHYNGESTNLGNGAVFYGPNGGKIAVVTSGDGQQFLQLTTANSTSPIMFSSKPPASESNSASVTTFHGPNGATATIVNTENGQRALKVTSANGTTIYTPNQVIQYNGSLGEQMQPNNFDSTYDQTSYNQPSATMNNSDNKYNSYLPPGIPASQIPKGQEDLYILKSEVVPPVCPMCPSNSIARQEPCPACPPCGRCPEASFECKKVPNYDAANDISNGNSNSNYGNSNSSNYNNSSNSNNYGNSNINSYVPVPVLSDFSTFGM